MAKFYDVTEWEEKPFFQTKGTRNKCVISNPSDNWDYYFKTSMKNEGKDYKPEFWSEIIASEVGFALGFNVLKYEIARRGSEVGCISKSMKSEEESLIEGISLLKGYSNSYNPDDKASYSQYTFNFIRSAIEFYNFKDGISSIIKTIIFDSIIGNSDRHQENWGYIVPYAKSNFSKSEVDKRLKAIASMLQKFRTVIVKNASNKTLNPKFEIQISTSGYFAPIYDSGCSLAREKSEETVKQMLKDKIMLDSFIERGKSEIRWDNTGKLNHFKLIDKIRAEHKNIIDNEINRIINIYEKQNINDIVFHVDDSLPKEYKPNWGLSDYRKELISRMIELRIERLKNVIL